MLARITKNKLALRIKVLFATSRNFVSFATLLAITNVIAIIAKFKSIKKKDSTKIKLSKTTLLLSFSKRDIIDEVRNLVASVSNILVKKMKLDANIIDFDIDSLISIKLTRKIEKTFKCTLDKIKQMKATIVCEFVLCVEHALFKINANVSLAKLVDDDNNNDDNNNDNEDFFNKKSKSSSLIVVEIDYEFVITT